MKASKAGRVFRPAFFKIEQGSQLVYIAAHRVLMKIHTEKNSRDADKIGFTQIRQVKDLPLRRKEVLPLTRYPFHENLWFYPRKSASNNRLLFMDLIL